MDVNPILNPEDKPDHIDATKIRAGSITADKLVINPPSGSKGLAQFINPDTNIEYIGTSSTTPSVRFNPDGTVTFHRPGNPS